MEKKDPEEKLEKPLDTSTIGLVFVGGQWNVNITASPMLIRSVTPGRDCIF